jgi:hypothetical protein
MAKRNPAKTRKDTIERNKRFAAFRTAVPLVLTLLLLGLVYVFVLLPDSPSNSLKNAILNSFDADKQKSYRYDGSFGDTNRGYEGEYSGQKANNGNTEFRVRLKNESLYTSLETMNIGENSYVRIDGVQNLNAILAKITGVKQPTDMAYSLLQTVQGKWIEVTPTSRSTVQSLVPCMDVLPGFGGRPEAPKMDESNYPFVLKSGPSKTKDDSEDRTYEATLLTERVATAPEVAITSIVNCLESEFGAEDPRLRDSGKVDEQSMRFTFTVDPLSNTVNRMVVKQVGQYFQLVMRDYNKDVTINKPETTAGLAQVYLSLSPDQQSFLITEAGIDIGSVLQ